MIYVLTLALLLVAGTAGAEQTETFGCATIPQGKECTFSHQQLEQMDREHSCLATMAAALKSLEGFLPEDVYPRAFDMAHRILSGEKISRQETDQIVQDNARIYNLWTAAKACWRETH